MPHLPAMPSPASCRPTGARRVAAGLLAAVAASLSFGAAAAAATPHADEARARFERERAACLEGRSHQDRATCLREATNAYDEARRPSSGPQSRPDADQRRRNALARCERVRDEDRADCRRLALGEGTRSGSVEGGGVIKEIVTEVPAPPTPR
ncbi:hypothetical protein [Piscinibacter sakaiensis]|uniref:Putative exported protein n=1 Tax=Piscinibacter sakaiensis TaxID=1547922 RepID=A0A0K8NXY7_PISS1|nr:hypothetical protein [Piscinibacter sakaiensis]GAP35246.1 putative exported protein [Piscinibacter sakaiensis]